jgi:hypothetical protein
MDGEVGWGGPLGAASPFSKTSRDWLRGGGGGFGFPVDGTVDLSISQSKDNTTHKRLVIQLNHLPTSIHCPPNQIAIFVQWVFVTQFYQRAQNRINLRNQLCLV